MVNSFYIKHGKRIFDLCLTFPTLSLLLFPMAVIATLVFFSFGKPVFFRQIRPGLKGRPITIYKFRTMTDEVDQNGRLLPDKDRLKPIGRILRNMSLDELPELFNVLKGEMSLIGPRPLLTKYLKLYTSEQARRHEVKPGITGLAQVNGRNAIAWEKKFEYDILYVDNLSAILDIKILIRTIGIIIRREGINQPGQATAEEFNPQDMPTNSELLKDERAKDI